MRHDEIEDFKNAIKTQQQNSIEDSAYAQYCGSCGNKTCTCEYKQRKVEQARQGVIESAESESRFLNGLGGILFIIAALLVAKYLHMF